MRRRAGTAAHIAPGHRAGRTALAAQAGQGAGKPGAWPPPTSVRPGTGCRRCATPWVCRAACAAAWRRGGTGQSLGRRAAPVRRAALGAVACAACDFAAGAGCGEDLPVAHAAAAAASASGLAADSTCRVAGGYVSSCAWSFCGPGPAAVTQSGSFHRLLRAKCRAEVGGSLSRCWSRGGQRECRRPRPTGSRRPEASACGRSALEACAAHGPTLAPKIACGRAIARQSWAPAECQCLPPAPRRPAPQPPQKREKSDEAAVGRRPAPSGPGSAASNSG